jgi:hypothetical protein
MGEDRRGGGMSDMENVQRSCEMLTGLLRSSKTPLSLRNRKRFEELRDYFLDRAEFLLARIRKNENDVDSVEADIYSIVEIADTCSMKIKRIQCGGGEA